jgi:hypothetical protein
MEVVGRTAKYKYPQTLGNPGRVFLKAFFLASTFSMDFVKLSGVFKLFHCACVVQLPSKVRKN